MPARTGFFSIYLSGGGTGNSNTISVTTLALATKVELTGPSTATAGAVSDSFTSTYYFSLSEPAVSIVESVVRCQKSEGKEWNSG
jgi:hypothetical protein